jgi:curved DNA-binding protein CbpA
VRQYHPDHNRSHAAWAERKLKAIIAAYRVLRDPTSRTQYDLRLRAEKESIVYRDAPISARATSPGAQASAILFDLVNGRGRHATQHFERLSAQEPDFDLAKYLSRNDYLDCKFLLGEEFEKQRKYQCSAECFVEVYEARKSVPHLKSFADELRERIRVLYCRHLAPDASASEALACYRKALRLKLPRVQRAFVLKKMAERFLEAGDVSHARSALSKALALKPNMKGAQRICERLGSAPTA